MNRRTFFGAVAVGGVALAQEAKKAPKHDRLSGRIVYTTRDGSSGAVPLSKVDLGPGETATTERMLAWQPASGYRARRAEAHAEKAVRAAEELGKPMLIAEALAALAAVEFQRGRGVRFDLIDRALALEAVDAHASLSRQPRWAIAGILMYAGLLDQGNCRWSFGPPKRTV